jgi:predicted O-methyltransferase YrrM
MRSPVEKAAPLASPWRNRVRSAVLGAVEKRGFRLERLEDTATFIDDDSTRTPELLAELNAIPGMVSLKRGMYYYLLAYAGPPGNIIELGSWQGRSTSFLARACKDTGNGVVHAVDWFKGNPGTEHLYGGGDLRAGFDRNISNAGLDDVVVVHDGDSVELAPEVIDAAGDVRMLVVDAEHTYDAVQRELRAYADVVVSGGLVVFDDYSKRYEGVARAIHEHVDAHPRRYSRMFQDQNLLVMRRL